MGTAILNRWEIGIIVVAPVVFASLIAAAWHLSPSVRERAFEAALAFGPHPLKKHAATALRDYPTRDAALALVAFLNLNNPAALSDAALENLSPEERRAIEAGRDAEVARRRELGEAALISLCELSGQSFGTLYEKKGTGYTWGSPSLRMWPAVIAGVNRWAAGTFGVSLLAAAAPGPDAGGSPDVRMVLREIGGGEAGAGGRP